MFFTYNMADEETDSFDPNSIVEPQLSQPPLMTSNAIYTFQDTTTPHLSNLSAEDLSSSASMEIQLQLHNQNQNHNHLLSFDSSLPDSSFATPTPDLLSLYHFPKSSPAAASFLPLSFPHAPHLNFAGEIPMVDAASVCDPLLYLNLPPQPHLVRDLFQSLPPNGYTVFGDEQIGANGGGMYGDYNGGEEPAENGVMEFSFKSGKRRRGGKGTKQFVNDRERRVQVKDTYEVLRNLVPKPSKDRASIVADAIKYIKELTTSVNDLKMLVEKKRCAKDRKNKRLKTEEDSTENGLESSCITKPGINIADSTTDQASFNNGSLRSSWVQRKSKDTEVDVRIIADEVTIKLVQRKRMNRLVYVSKILDELQLDLHHVAGGHVGDYYSFLFNTKINEGSCVYASGIANRIMEMAEEPNASTPSTSCY